MVPRIGRLSIFHQRGDDAESWPSEIDDAIGDCQTIVELGSKVSQGALKLLSVRKLGSGATY